MGTLLGAAGFRFWCCLEVGTVGITGVKGFSVVHAKLPIWNWNLDVVVESLGCDYQFLGSWFFILAVWLEPK